MIVSYNRADVIETTLTALRFFDELVVVDKTSTDGTDEIGRRYADRFLSVPWTPIGEETRQQAIDLCSHDWIVSLDDDECLTPACIEFLMNELHAPRAEVILVPLRHFVLGKHDPRAYYWPEYRPCFFRRGALSFSGRVHGGVRVNSGQCYHLPLSSDAAILNLSHRDIYQWLEKTNRYTSKADRVSTFDVGGHPSRRVLEALLFSRFNAETEEDPYLAAVTILRGIYDVVDYLKRWESDSRQAGTFDEVCDTLNAHYRELGSRITRNNEPRGGRG